MEFGNDWEVSVGALEINNDPYIISEIDKVAATLQ
jgi:hypothetical protein